jgi:hypothetical protein
MIPVPERTTLRRVNPVSRLAAGKPGSGLRRSPVFFIEASFARQNLDQGGGGAISGF